MILAKLSSKPKTKSRIARRIRSINTMLLFSVLVLMAAVTVFIIRGINNEAAMNRVRAYSIEAAQIFYSYFSEDLTLVRKAAFSRAISEWCADESNEEKKVLAFHEMMNYISIVPGAHLYLGISESNNEYRISYDSSLEHFFPVTRLNPSVIEDAWYFKGMGSDNEYSLNIGLDASSNNWLLWINHKVFSAGNVVGIFCSGLRIPDVFRQVFGQRNDIRGYIINNQGIIQLASAVDSIYREKRKSRINYENIDPAFAIALNGYLADINGLFSPHSQPVVLRLAKGPYGHASIAPIIRSDWSVVVFYNSHFMSDIADVLPVFFVMLLATFLYMLGRHAILNWLLFLPLSRLTQSISEGKAGGRIFGSNREDEIGELARTIHGANVEKQRQAEQLREAKERIQVLLDAMPLTIQLWRRERRMFDCSEEAVKLFKTKDKQEVFDRFFDLSPKYQSDGQLSIEKAFGYLDRAFEEGRCAFEWMHQTIDGIPLPSELTLVRVKFGDEYVVASYVRDLREQKRMMREIERQKHLLEMVNGVSSLLIEPYMEKFEKNLLDSMSMMGQVVGVDRVYIWKNHLIDGNLHCTQLYEWSEGAEPQQNSDYTVNVSYATIPGWREALSQGKCITRYAHNMSPEEQAQLVPQGILSILVVPVFMQGEFWGFIGFDDCHRERVFTENEEMILRSGSLIIVNALKRNEMALNIRQGAAKLEAVIANYPGIIWCVDRNNVITLFNGHYLYQLETRPEFFEGKKCDEVLLDNCFLGIRSSVHETFAKGALDWNFDSGDKMYRIQTTPIHDDSGNIANVMGSFEDITERARLQIELKAALEETKAASQAKSNFLANMSHEMRTPLNAVIGLSELTIETCDLNEEAGLNLEKIRNAGATLLSTVNDILDISKIEAGKLALVPVEYEIPILINDAINQSILRIGEKPIKFILNIDDTLPTRLFGDDIRIKQILSNLLSNAFKYTRKGTVNLSLSCERENDSVWMTIRVSDTGIGIREEDLGNLFSSYTQMDSKSNRKIEGTGLGLPITKKIAEMMEGSVSVESEYGKGSVFTVRIRQQFVNDAVIGAEVTKNLKEFRYMENKRSHDSRLERIKLPYARVLVVDDLAINLDVATGLMKLYGMQVDCVTSGQEAVDAVRAAEVKYNAIFMDHMMPGMDGIEAVRIIREEIGTEYAKTVPVIALSANAIVGNKEMFLENGFQTFLPKPIEMTHLDAVLREWVQDKKLEQTLDHRKTKNQRSPVERIDNLDIDKGIERFNGDRQSYFQILRSYAKSSRPLLGSISKLNTDILSAGNLTNYKISVHGIKGASWGICAGPVGDKAEALEKAAKAGDIAFILDNNAAFIEAAEKLCADIEAMLDRLPANELKPKKDKPDREILARLLIACEAYDMDGVDAAMSEIEIYEYKSDYGLAVWLREHIEKMDFAQVKEKLATLL